MHRWVVVTEEGEVVGHLAALPQFAPQYSPQFEQEGLSKNTFQPHLRKQWSIPPKANAEFVWSMCLRSTPAPMIYAIRKFAWMRSQSSCLEITRQSLTMEPGKPKRQDYEYERGGVVNVFMFCEPLQGRRWGWM
jgi:hypothetical protein